MKNHKYVASTEIVVSFNDCDPLGIVWHGNYFKYFELGREAFSDKYGLDYLALYNEGYIVPVVNVQCDYKRPLRYRDKAVVQAVFKRTEAAKILFEYTVYRADNKEVVCTASSIQVFVNRTNLELNLVAPASYSTWLNKIESNEGGLGVHG